SSPAYLTVSFNVSKALPTIYVAVSNSDFTVSRNQVATGLMTLFLMNAHASRSEPRKRLNPVFTESITRDSIGQAVSRNHVTTGLITLFLQNAHDAFNESHIVLKARFPESITVRRSGNVVFCNHATTALTAVFITVH